MIIGIDTLFRARGRNYPKRVNMYRDEGREGRTGKERRREGRGSLAGVW